MAKTTRSAQPNPTKAKPRKVPAAKTRSRAPNVKPAASPVRDKAEPARSGWATELVFDVREPKLAVSLRLDADVLRFFRGFGSGYQTRINEVLKAFMHARGEAETISHPVVSAKSGRTSGRNGKRASR
jgi:uncharacterized protein (DUF4415 family)